MKKIIPIILILVLMIGTLAYSQDFEDIKDTKYEEAVKLLSGYEIVNGFEDGTFRPDEPVTRGQMAKMLTIVLGYKEYSQGMKTNFEDAKDHWSEPYIEVVNSFDIVTGYDDNTFKPDKYISSSEATTMIMRTLGYTDKSLQEDWPYNYLSKALDLGVLDNVAMYTSYATRGDVALMISQSLNLPTVEINTFNSPVQTENTLFENLGYKEENINITKSFVEENRENSKVNLDNYIFHIGDIYYNNEDKIVHIGNLITEEVYGKATSISSRLIFIRDEAGNTRPYIISDSEIIFNKDQGKYLSLLDADVKVVYKKNGDLEALGITGTKVTNTALVSNRYQQGEITYQGVDLPIRDGEVDFEKIEVWGSVDSLNEIRPNDFLYFYESDRAQNNKNYLGIEVVRNSVEGVINSTSTNNTNLGHSTIGGELYQHSIYYQTNPKLAPGYYARVYLDGEGKIVKYDLIDYLLTPDTYGLVTSTTEGNGNSMPRVNLLEEKNRKTNYTVPMDNPLVEEVENFNSRSFILNLNEGNIVLYGTDENGNLDEIEKIKLEDYSGTYRSTTGRLEDRFGRITDDTLIYFYEEGWKTISKNDLGEIINAKIYLNSRTQTVEVMVLEEGIKTDYQNHLYSPVLNIEEALDPEDNPVYKFEIYIEGKNRVIFTENNNINTAGIENNFIQLNIRENKISSIEKLTPEAKEKPLQGIYKDTLMKIDGSYWEFSKNSKIYTADKDENGNYTFTGYTSIENLKEGDLVNIYDLEGNFDGVIDHVILIN